MSTFTTQRALSRRHLLRGLGTSMALPFLDAMSPALRAAPSLPAATARRLGYFFMPMGADMSRWTPSGGPGESALTDLPFILQPLERVVGQVSILSNMEIRNAYPGTHATSNAAFLSCAKAKHTESNDYFLGTTVDQIAARHLGRHTTLPSLELGMDMMQVAGQCDNGYACVYQNNLSWASPTTPLPAEAHPRMVFEMLFGAGGSKADRRSALRRRASLLDFVKDDMQRLKRELGPADRGKVAEYLDAVRDVEQRVQRAESGLDTSPLPDLDRPRGVPSSYLEHARLMLDMQLLAFRGDVTRVTTFQLARETSNRVYPEAGVTDPHHPLSHHGNDPEKIERMSRINRFHVSLFAEYVEKLKQTPDGDGSLLDHTLLLYGSGMGNPNVHDHVNLPLIVAGGASHGFKGGRHIHFAKTEPLANLHLSLLDKAGVQLEQFADSTGKISGLFTPLGI